MLSVIFVFEPDSCDGDGTEINLVPHALHAVIADLARIQITAVTFPAAIADLPIIQQTFLLLAH